MAKCRECGNRTQEFLIKPRPKKFLFFNYTGAKVTNLCRDHLIRQFKDEFLKMPQRMVVIYPNMEEKNGNYQYFFTTMDNVERGFAPDKETNDRIWQLVRQWLDSITGGCRECGFSGAVAYIGKEEAKWKVVPGFMGAEFDYPMIQEIDATPKILCRSCAFKHIESSMRVADKGFEEGVFCPNGDEEGIYVTIEV